MAKPMLRKSKQLIFLLLILIPAIIPLSFLPGVKAEVSIISVTPSSGCVGDSVWVIANTTTENGPYEIFFDQEEVVSGTAVGTIVNASFTVPQAVKGLHNVTVRADTSEANANFAVLTKYVIKTNATDPTNPLKQPQENDTVGIFLSITEGESDATYSANVTVRTPKNENYSMNVSLLPVWLDTTKQPGNYNATITYPGTEWTAEANTNYTGTYAISWLNGTEVLETGTFFVGLTNQSKYHREDPVDIKAVDYKPDQNVTITMSGVDTSYSVSFNATADPDGVVHYTDWTIPQNATVGNYTLSITPSKSGVNDTQTFEVPGFKTEIFTTNLANRIVPNVFVRAYDESTNTFYNATSGEEEAAQLPASFMLERGDHCCEAFFKDVRVGEINFTISEEKHVDFTCQLTSVNIDVIDAQNISVPFVAINLTYNYTTDLIIKENRTGTESGETNVTALTLQLPSLLPNITYTINASRYGEVFNQNNNTIDHLPAKAYENITILCPTRKLQVQVTDANDKPIINVVVKAQELMGGLDYNNSTDTNGTAVLDCTFGKYVVKVYKGEIMLNETTFDLFDDQNKTIKCPLYGLIVSIKVVDYFGQPISKANVRLQREGLALLSKRTKSGGIATFDSIIGGSVQIAVYLAGQTQPCVTKSFFIDSSTTVEIRVEKYVMLAGFLVETSQLTTAIIIAVAVILILLVEVYRRKRLKPKKSSS